MKFRVFFIILLVFCSQIQAKDEYFREYWDPTFHLLRMNYCTADGKLCGKELANEYCKVKGYDRAIAEKKAFDVGVTNYYGTKFQCQGCCNGFEYIRCAKKISHDPPKDYHYRSKSFKDPCLNGERINFCYEKAKNCGTKAANAFCRHMGYEKANDYARILKLSQTKNIGTGELCIGGNCSGFSHITCYR